MSAEYRLERVGDEYAYVWDDYGVAIGFEQLRQERWGLSGEIHVRTALALASTGRPGHIFSGIYNLSKLDDRDKLVKSLGTRNDRIPWVDLLETARVETSRLHRRGDPAVRLRDVVGTPQRHLIDPIVPLDQTSVLYGDGASTKSTFARLLALAVASGHRIGPVAPTDRATVLVLDYETEAEEWNDGMARLADGAGLDDIPATLYYRRQWRPIADDIAPIRAEIARVGATFVIIDSMLLALGADVAPDAVAPFYNALRSLDGTTRLVLTHLTKEASQQQNGIPDPYGSIFVKNYARSVWFLKREEGDDGIDFEVSLIHRKVNRGRLQPAMGVHWRFVDPDGPITCTEIDPMANPVLAQHGSLIDRMAAALRSGRLSTKELAEEIGATEKVIGIIGARGVRTGRFVRLDEHAQSGHGSGRGHVAFYGLATSKNGRHPADPGAA